MSISEKTDADGNVIPDYDHQCVFELTTGLQCSARGCQVGFCEQTGTGMTPEDPFIVECVANESAPPFCPPTNNSCTVAVCNADGTCGEENLPLGTDCNDDNACTFEDECDGQGVCAGTESDIESACGVSPDPCRTYTCDENLGCVLTEPANENGPCNDGDPCTMNDACNGQDLCIGGMAVSCPSDNDVCTDDVCKPGTGCVYPPTTTSPAPTCSDGNACTTADTCVDGVCVGNLLDCSANLDPECQIGFCDVTAGCQVINLTGPYGQTCTTPFPGICSEGRIMCLEGVNTGMCEPLVRPGDKDEICVGGDVDEDCDNLVNEDPCQLFGAAYDGPDGLADFYQIDPMAGTATLIGPIGFQRVSAMDVLNNGTLYATAERNDGSNTAVLISIDIVTGTGTEVGPLGGTATGAISDMSFRNSDNALFAYDASALNHRIFIIDVTSGAASLVGSTGFSTAPGNSLTFDLSDVLFHSQLETFPNPELNTIDQVTGVGTYVLDLTVGDGNDRFSAMDAHPLTGLVYGILRHEFPAASSELATIDTTTGIVTAIGLTITNMDALTWR